MSKYRVTMKINFMVTIDEDNLLADPSPALQGDTPRAALNRACHCWLQGMKLANKTCQTLGVKRSYALTEDWDVALLDTPDSKRKQP